MPGTLDTLSEAIKKQPGKRYRFVRLDSTNVSDKKVRGYNFVRSEDPEVKGTILERDHKGSDGKIQVGNLALARISEKDAQEHDKRVQERTDRRLRAIKLSYQEDGEKIKRELGPRHKDFKIIHKEE